MNLPIPTTPSAQLVSLIEDTIEFAGASRAASTVERYTACWEAFTRFCADHALPALPADPRTVVVFLTALAKSGKALATVQSHLSALKYQHDRRRQPFDANNPLISEVMAGIRRTLGRAQEGSDALLPDDLRKMMEVCAEGNVGLRDRALLLLGFSGAFRRSELVSLTVEDIEEVAEGLVIKLRRSKTDQEGKGIEKAIPYAQDEALCPITALKTWLSAAGIAAGPIFRRVRRGGGIGTDALSDTAVYQIVLKLVEAAGLTGKITPHSLRAGFCTAAAMKGAKIDRIATHAGHANIQTTLRYVRVAERFKDHAGEGLL